MTEKARSWPPNADPQPGVIRACQMCQIEPDLDGGYVENVSLSVF
jgi:hypothetical protein